MAPGHTVEFRRDAVRIAITNGLKRPKVAGLADRMALAWGGVPDFDRDLVEFGNSPQPRGDDF